MRSELRVLLSLAGTAAVAVACAGGNGDDDDTSSPTPTPVNVDYCQIVWVTQEPPIAVGTTTYDIFLVDAPLGAWTTGTKSYGVSAPGTFVGVFYDGRETDTGPARNAAVTTSGSFGLVLANGTTTDAGVQWSDTSVQQFFALDQAAGTVGAFTGTGGTGSFDGVWSDPDTLPLTPGSGLVTVVWMGTSLQLGVQGSYARCYDRPTTFQSRSAATLSFLFEEIR